ncbi:MAG: hypothetical protein AAGG51_15650 [Cyanobacteria bacterium P01_G01_bin.54]
MPQGDYVRTSETLPLAIAPQVVGIESQRLAAAGYWTVAVDCLPQVRPSQRVLLLLGDRGVPLQEAIALPDAPTAPSRLTFRVKNIPPGDYVVRLRVDGVDSIPVDFATRPLGFDEHQRLSIEN